MYCNECGRAVRPGSPTCGTCGATVQPPQAGLDTATVMDVDSALVAMQTTELGRTDGVEDVEAAVLVLARGPDTGRRYLLGTEVTRIGRDPRNEIFLDDVTVSRRHAEVRRSGASFVLVDLGSVNGTYVRGERREEARLAHRDQVQVGRFRLVFFDTRQGSDR